MDKEKQTELSKLQGETIKFIRDWKPTGEDQKDPSAKLKEYTKEVIRLYGVSPQLIYNGKAYGYNLIKGNRYRLLWCDKDYYQMINEKGEKQKYAREYFEVLDIN